MHCFTRILPVLLLALALTTCKGPKVVHKDEPDLAATDTVKTGETLFDDDFDSFNDSLSDEGLNFEEDPEAVDDYGPPSKQWEVPEYVYARLYVYNLDHEEGSIISEGKLNPSVVPLTEKELSYMECRQIIEAISDPPYVEQNMCFVPHHGVVFYDESDQPVAWASICLMCKVVETVPASNDVADFRKLRMLFEKKGLPVYPNLSGWNRYRDDSLWVPKPHEEK